MRKANEEKKKAGKLCCTGVNRYTQGGMKNREIERLQKELDRLGIINIEADSMLSIELAKTAIEVVKSVN